MRNLLKDATALVFGAVVMVTLTVALALYFVYRTLKGERH